MNLLLNGGYEDNTSANGVADNWNTYADPGITPIFEVVREPAVQGSSHRNLLLPTYQAGDCIYSKIQ
ncbi:hypothetical protein [Paenibacillus kobensis]|uniref:hypothetical protein n=1 Tax=Paenibacillus kobensis TaxID=59841 RepID=UPI000FD8C4C2|nr:hypothetical protein [Paenibacillus kobensis]